MMILITYDVNTLSASGSKRLRKVAKACENYGLRVQNSVFECIISETQLVALKAIISDIIDEKQDSIRIYHLGKNWERHVETMGRQPELNAESTLII